MPVEDPHVAVHLADVLVRELPELEVDEQVALEDDVVEDEVDEEVIVVERDPLLAGDEREALAQLQEELGQLADDGSLEVTLSVLVTARQPQEIEDERRLDEVARPLDGLPFRASSITPALFRLLSRRRWSAVKIWRSRWGVDQFSRSASIS